MVEGVRFSDRTDIDYVGKELDRKVLRMADDIGKQVGLGRGWLNNDLMMAGTDLEDLEWSTGPLHFRKAFELGVITVNTLCMEDLLRMKVIAIDTSWTAVECGGDFTREKDFEDVRLLMERMGVSYNEMVEQVFDYVECPEVLYLIKWYNQHPGDAGFIADGRCKEIINNKGK